MTLKYTITQNDYVQFNVFHSKHSSTIKRLIFLLRILLPVLFILIAITTNRFDVIWLTISVLFSITWILLLPSLFQKTMEKNVDKLISEGKTNEFIGECTLIMMEDRVHSEINNRITETPYTSIERIALDQERIYVYVGALSAYIIPFSAFSGEQEKQDVMALLKARSGQLND